MTAIELSSYAGLAAMTLLTFNILIGLVMSVKYNPVRNWPHRRINTFKICPNRRRGFTDLKRPVPRAPRAQGPASLRLEDPYVDVALGILLDVGEQRIHPLQETAHIVISAGVVE